MNSRVKYGFTLKFPQSVGFTVSDLRRQKRGTISYITLKKRVEKAMADGVIFCIGKKTHKGSGRPQQVFSTTNPEIA